MKILLEGFSRNGAKAQSAVAILRIPLRLCAFARENSINLTTEY